MVSSLARLELELKDEHNPSIPDPLSVDATLHVKGKTLRACDRSFDLKHAMHAKLRRTRPTGRQASRPTPGPGRTAQRKSAKSMGAQPPGLDRST